MFFDLIQYKIRIIRPNTGLMKSVGRYFPIDVPGRVLGLNTKSEALIVKYINKHRLLEVICGERSFGRAEINIRWDNDARGWYDVNNHFALLSSCYPSCKSIWITDQTPIIRDLRPAHERKPNTIRRTFLKTLASNWDKEELKYTRSSSKPVIGRAYTGGGSYSEEKKSLFNEYYGGWASTNAGKASLKDYEDQFIRKIKEETPLEPQMIEIEIPPEEQQTSFHWAASDLATRFFEVNSSTVNRWRTDVSGGEV